MDRRQQTYLAKGMIKRLGVTILCCIPLLIILGYFMQGVNRIATIFTFVGVMLVVICVVEYICARRSVRKEILKKSLHKDEDVFK